MARPHKEQRSLHCRLKETVALQLERFSRDTGKTKTEIVENALEQYMQPSKTTEEQRIKERSAKNHGTV